MADGRHGALVAAHRLLEGAAMRYIPRQAEQARIDLMYSRPRRAGVRRGAAVAALLAVAALVAALASSTPASGAAPGRPPPSLRDSDFRLVPDAPPLIVDPGRRTPAPTRPAAPVPAPPAIIVEVAPAAAATIAATIAATRSTRSLTGLASWYCLAGRSSCYYAHPDGPGYDAYAAAGPRLRAAICGDQACTSWRGRTVLVDGQPVRLTDWCACFWHQPKEKIIDLYHDVFFGDSSHPGVGGDVTITW